MNARIASLIEGAGSRAMDLEELIGRLGLGRDQVEHALDELAGEGSIRDIGETPRVVVAAAVLEEVPPLLKPSGNSISPNRWPRASAARTSRPDPANCLAASVPRCARSPGRDRTDHARSGHRA